MKPYRMALALTPESLKRLIDDVKPEKYEERVAPDRFNLIEMVAHLADFEDIFLDRMRSAQEFPGKTIVAYDPDQRAEEKHYATRNLHHEIEVFENRRRDTIEFLESLKPEEWGLAFKHPEYGDITIDEQVALMLGHDLTHLEQATHYLR
jgi:uncharacterized damage-inducible protein DinB